ncbi:TPA: hypothetical protein ACN35C_004699 [Vibrio parahaemolyticus]
MQFIIEKIEEILAGTVKEEFVFDFVHAGDTYMVSIELSYPENLLLRVDFNKDNDIEFLQFDYTNKKKYEKIEIVVDAVISDFGLKEFLEKLED